MPRMANSGPKSIGCNHFLVAFLNSVLVFLCRYVDRRTRVWKELTSFLLDLLFCTRSSVIPSKDLPPRIVEFFMSTFILLTFS